MYQSPLCESSLKLYSKQQTDSLTAQFQTASKGQSKYSAVNQFHHYITSQAVLISNQNLQLQIDPQFDSNIDNYYFDIAIALLCD